jgi:hypothetical protein
MLADPCTKSGADCTRVMNMLNVSHLAVTPVDVRQSSQRSGVVVRNLSLWNSLILGWVVIAYCPASRTNVVVIVVSAMTVVC